MRFLTEADFETFYPVQRLESLAGSAISYFNFVEVDRAIAITKIKERAIKNAENATVASLRGSYSESDIPDTPATTSEELKQLVSDYSFWYLFQFIDQEDRKSELLKSIFARLKFLKDGKSLLKVNIDETLDIDPTIFITTNITQVKEPFGEKARLFYWPDTFKL